MSGHDGHVHIKDETCFSGIEDSCRERAQIYDMVWMSKTKLSTSEVVRLLWPGVPAGHHYNRVYTALRAMAGAGHISTDGMVGRRWWVVDLPPAMDRPSVERWLDA